MKKSIDALSKELQESCDSISKLALEKVTEGAVDLKNRVVRDSPSSKKRSGKKYKRGWAIECIHATNTSVRFRLRNKNKPMLVHLLEHGHAKANGGRVAAIPHVLENKKKVQEEVAKKVKEVIKNGIK